MSKFIGRLFNIGLGKEVTRGTAVAAAYWFPKTDFSVEDKISTVVNNASIGIIEDAENQEVTQKLATASIGGQVSDISFGLLLMAALGTDTVGAVESGVKDHVFTVLESAQHPSLTLVASEPNANGSSSLKYALGMLSKLEIDIAVGAFMTYKADMTMNTATTGSSTPAFVVENLFRPQDCTFRFASSYSGLGAASAINVRSAQITIEKNIEDDTTVGNQSATDRYNKEFVITGEVVLVYDARTYIADMIANTFQAIRILATRADVTIGAASNPTLTIDLAKAFITEVARTDKNGDVMLQTLKFKAHYSQGDSLMTQITLRNTNTSSY